MSVTFVTMYCGECGIEFAVPDYFHKERVERGTNWHCPNGHSRVYKESEATKMRRERDSALQKLALRDAEVLVQQKRIKRLEKRAAVK